PARVRAAVDVLDDVPPPGQGPAEVDLERMAREIVDQDAQRPPRPARHYRSAKTNRGVSFRHLARIRIRLAQPHRRVLPHVAAAPVEKPLLRPMERPHCKGSPSFPGSLPRPVVTEE